jgi:hypothetical protein
MDRRCICAEGIAEDARPVQARNHVAVDAEAISGEVLHLASL